MRFLIDAYNLMHAMGLLHGPVGPHGLTKARLALIGRLAAAHGESGVVTLVFDARGAPAGADAEETRGSIHIVYTLREEADDYIEDRVAHDAAPTKLVVVSNDRRLREAAGRRGCESWLCGRYLDWIEQAERDRLRAKPPEPDKPADSSPGEIEHWKKIFGEAEGEP